MRYLILVLFPLFVFAEKPAKKVSPYWICEGYVQGYDELEGEISNRWKQIKTFQFDGPSEVNNSSSTEITFDKHKAIINFIYNKKGTMSIGDEKIQSEGVSMSVSVGNKKYGDGDFQVLDGAVLPDRIGFRSDFEEDNKAYFVRTICKRNKK